MTETSGEEKLERTISYVLIAGVIGSVVVESIGIASYYYSAHNLNIVFQPSLALKATNFFSYAAIAIQALFNGFWTPLQILGLGIVVLMITPYMRVFASVVYFGLAKNPRYLFITLFVLVVLTASLLVH
jgi:uncharacterized membrane protein